MERDEGVQDGGRPSIVWLASYPKSGNTWLRALLTSCLTDGTTPNLDNLLGSPVASQRDLLDDHAGITSADYSLDELLPFEARLHRDLARERVAPLFIKTHSAFIATEGSTRLFAADARARVIYLVRNPFDVVPSLAGHLGCALDEAIDTLGQMGWLMDSWRNRSSSNLPQRVGNWSENVTSWTGQSDIPLLLVRYEDLLSDPVGQLSRVCTFAGLSVGTKRIGDAVRSCHFAQLRDEEERSGFGEKPRSGMRFFRSGRAGLGVRELTASQRKSIWLTHGSAIRDMGYPMFGDA